MPLNAVEEMIQAAIARGEFDNLPGKGKPLDLDAYFAMPEDERSAFTMLKNAGFLPEEVQLLRDAELLKKRLQTVTGEDERAKLKRQLDDKVLAFNIAMDRRRGRRAGKR